MWFWRCVEAAFGHFLLGSHNFMVTVVGLCVKWPLYLGPLHTRGWEPVWPLFHFKHSYWWKWRSRSKFASHCAWGTGVDSYVASNGSCFMVTWTILKNRLLEVGLTQNRETMAVWALTTVGLFYFIMHKDLHNRCSLNSIWLRAQSHMASHYTWGSVTTLHDVGGVLGRPLDTFFWALPISWLRFLACVWSDLTRIEALITKHLRYFVPNLEKYKAVQIFSM